MLHLSQVLYVEPKVRCHIFLLAFIVTTVSQICRLLNFSQKVPTVQTQQTTHAHVFFMLDLLLLVLISDLLHSCCYTVVKEVHEKTLCYMGTTLNRQLVSVNQPTPFAALVGLPCMYMAMDYLTLFHTVCTVIL